MRRTLALTPILPILVALLAGCSKQEEVTTPVACLDSASKWEAALSKVPGQVTLGGTRISDCLPADQPAGQQETVGRTALEVATDLAAERPKGTVAYQAGYLVGALERGAANTQGIHSTLLGRVEAAATNGLDRQPPPVQAAYEAGHKAGLESG